MNKYPLFLSIVCVIHNKENECKEIINNISKVITNLTDDYEIIIVDNSSKDKTIKILEELTRGNDAVKNLQVFTLTNKVDKNIASWAGVENSLGDYVITLDPDIDDINFIPKILEKTIPDIDVSFINNSFKLKHNFFDNSLILLNKFFLRFIPKTKINFKGSEFRMISRKVINFIFNYPKPYIVFSNLASITGFKKLQIEYDYEFKPIKENKTILNINNSVIDIIKRNHFPIRLASMLMLLSSFLNLVYVFYIALVYIFKSNIEEGWTTLSLQLSGMFFLISIVLFIICEYLYNLNNSTNDGPLFHIGQEFKSDQNKNFEKLNIEDLEEKN